MKSMIKGMGTREMGSLLRDRRKGMTQEQLEELSGVSQGMISRLERGEIQRPNLEFVRAIGKALDAPYEELVGALYGSQIAAGDLSGEEEMIVKWRVLELPPDTTTDELLMLKHLFRGIRGYRDEVLGPQSGAGGRQASRARAVAERETAGQPALFPVREEQAEQG
jgi:transcriptional regulator with XRE-family HTH domain